MTYECPKHPRTIPITEQLGDPEREFDPESGVLFEVGVTRTRCGEAGCSHVLHGAPFRIPLARQAATAENVIAALNDNSTNFITPEKIEATMVGWCPRCTRGLVTAEAIVLNRDVGRREAMWTCDLVGCDGQGRCLY